MYQNNNTNITLIGCTSSPGHLTPSIGYINLNATSNLIWSTSKGDLEYMISYIDMFSKINGFPTFEKFKEMTECEIEAFIRLQKIKKIEE